MDSIALPLFLDCTCAGFETSPCSMIFVGFSLGGDDCTLEHCAAGREFHECQRRRQHSTQGSSSTRRSSQGDSFASSSPIAYSSWCTEMTLFLCCFNLIIDRGKSARATVFLLLQGERAQQERKFLRDRRRRTCGMQSHKENGSQSEYTISVFAVRS